MNAASEMSSAKRALAAAPDTAAAALPENGAGGAAGATGPPAPSGAGAFAVAVVECQGVASVKGTNLVATACGAE